MIKITQPHQQFMSTNLFKTPKRFSVFFFKFFFHIPSFGASLTLQWRWYAGDVTVLEAVSQVERHTANMHTRDEGIYYKNASTWNKLFVYKRIVSIVHCKFVWPACGHNETSSINRTEVNRKNWKIIYEPTIQSGLFKLINMMSHISLISAWFDFVWCVFTGF